MKTLDDIINEAPDELKIQARTLADIVNPILKTIWDSGRDFNASFSSKLAHQSYLLTFLIPLLNEFLDYHPESLDLLSAWMTFRHEKNIKFNYHPVRKNT
jgi:hypothetical protein